MCSRRVTEYTNRTQGSCLSDYATQNRRLKVTTVDTLEIGKRYFVDDVSSLRAYSVESQRSGVRVSPVSYQEAGNTELKRFDPGITTTHAALAIGDPRELKSDAELFVGHAVRVGYSEEDGSPAEYEDTRFVSVKPEGEAAKDPLLSHIVNNTKAPVELSLL